MLVLPSKPTYFDGESIVGFAYTMKALKVNMIMGPKHLTFNTKYKVGNDLVIPLEDVVLRMEYHITDSGNHGVPWFFSNAVSPNQRIIVTLKWKHNKRDALGVSNFCPMWRGILNHMVF